MFNRPVALLRDLIENLNRIPPDQIHFLEPALHRLVREVQDYADTHRRDSQVERFDAALEFLYEMRDALWARDEVRARKNGNEALRLLG